MANYGAMLLTTRAHLQPCAILRPRLFYVLICTSARVRVPGTLVHFILVSAASCKAICGVALVRTSDYSQPFWLKVTCPATMS